MDTSSSADSPVGPGNAWEVFWLFLRLGLTSFGGPVAHLGYFRQATVERLRWLSNEQFAQLLVISQLLPGPSSSQLGFGIGLQRAGWLGGLAAFAGFTLPSATLLFAFAAALPWLEGPGWGAVIHGLKLTALAVVAHGVLGMARHLCPDAPRRMLAVLVGAGMLLWGEASFQILAIALSAVAGWLFCRGVLPLAGGGLGRRDSRKLGAVLLMSFVLLLVGLPLTANASPLLAVASAFYGAGAMVFGGGHVVLPLLEAVVVQPGWISPETFLAGYGAAQVVPGPMFSVAAYLGASLPGSSGGLGGALVALLAIFLPGLLLLGGVLPFWRFLAGRPGAARAIAGVNAAVVGLLGAALYNPVWVSSVRNAEDLAIGLLAWGLLSFGRGPVWLVALGCVVASVGRWLLAGG